MERSTTDPGLARLGGLVAARTAPARGGPDHDASEGNAPGTSDRPTTIVGLGGGVAAGKSRLAEDLAVLLAADHGLDVLTVASDGFLLANDELDRRGLLDRKGFPESYDVEAIEALLVDVRAGQEVLELPVYDHLLYDVLDEQRRARRATVLLFEGVNVLQFADLLDVGIYLDADESDLRRWFVERVLRLRLAAADVPGAYLAPVAHWDDATVTEMAIAVWDAVNRPNLVEWIEPTRERADIVVVKTADHSIAEVRVRVP